MPPQIDPFRIPPPATIPRNPGYNSGRLGLVESLGGECHMAFPFSSPLLERPTPTFSLPL